MSTLADRLLPDRLWHRIRLLPPPPPSHAGGGAPRIVPDRAKSGSKPHVAGGERAAAGAAVDRGQYQRQRRVRGAAGRPTCGAHPGRWAALRPDNCHADKAYDHPHCRSYLARRGIKVRIARRGIESSTRLGRHLCKAERTIAWLAGCRRLRVRYDRDSERFFAFAMLACASLCSNRLHAGVKGMPPGRAG